MDVEQYINDEVVRQKSTNFDEFRDAYTNLCTISLNQPLNISLIVQNVARRVEPELNPWMMKAGTYTTLRTSHVHFGPGGGSATPTHEVFREFDRLMAVWGDVAKANDPRQNQTRINLEVDIWIRSLLQIHPWVDGNGRTASLLRNWMLGTLSDPTPLPYYTF